MSDELPEIKQIGSVIIRPGPTTLAAIYHEKLAEAQAEIEGLNKQLEACKAANKDADHSHRSGQKMSDLYKFGSEVAQTYTKLCGKCGRNIKVSTQRDRCPEYRAEVHVECVCGASVRFELPVN